MDTSILLISALVGLVIPLVTQLVARAHAPDQAKVVVTLVLVAADGVLTPLVGSSEHVDWKLIGFSMLSAFLTSLGAHQGLWKPFGVTGHEGALGQPVSVAPPCPECGPADISASTPTTDLPPDPAP